MENSLEFDLSLYNKEFFEWHLKYAREYSIKTMDYYCQKYKPTSVIDFGCGIGSYLESAYSNGIGDLKGYDIGKRYAEPFIPEHLLPFIHERDCTEPIFLDMRYDLVISFETIEHIDPKGTNGFLNNLVWALNVNGRLLFTGAPPEQDGCGHINCHTREYWLNEFSKRYCVEDAEMTDDLKNAWVTMGCPSYIINNLIVLKLQD